MIDKKDAEENAWRVHSLAADAIAKVDSKAAFVLTLESALGAGLIAYGQSVDLTNLIDSSTLRSTAFYIGVVCLLLSLIAAVAAVLPRLRGNEIRNEYSSNYVYFGHLKYWEAAELCGELEKSYLTEQICRQAIILSKLAWFKNFLVSLSFYSALVSVCTVYIALVG